MGERMSGLLLAAPKMLREVMMFCLLSSALPQKRSHRNHGLPSLLLCLENGVFLAMSVLLLPLLESKQDLLDVKTEG